MKFDYEDGCHRYHERINNNDYMVDDGILVSFLTTVGSVSEDYSISEKLMDTDLRNAEIKIEVNGVELSTDRIIKRLVTIMNSRLNIILEEER